MKRFLMRQPLALYFVLAISLTTVALLPLVLSTQGIIARRVSEEWHPLGALGPVVAALPLLRDKGHIQPGQRVLINGTSGSVGTFAVQLAKYFGAEVTAVCSGANHDMIKALGADKVIDYTKADFTQSGERYDLIFDAVWKLAKAKGKKALASNRLTAREMLAYQ